MKDKLTQENALKLLKTYTLASLAPELAQLMPPLPDAAVKAYDFKKPKKFTKDQFNSLQSIYENYARILGSYISGTLRSVCTVNLLSVQEKNSGMNFMQSPKFLASVNLDFPREDLRSSQMYVEVSRELSFSVLDKLLGGTGDCFDIHRDYTNFELGILDNFVGNILNLMKDPWSNYISIEPSYLRSETNFHLIRGLVADDNTFVEINLEIVFKSLKGVLKLLIPSVTLEGIFKCIYQKNSREMKEKRTSEQENYNGLMEAVRDTELTLTGVLGETQISVNDLVSLSPGDLIQLDKDGLEVTLYVEDMPHFKGRYLTKTKQKSVEILKTIS